MRPKSTVFGVLIVIAVFGFILGTRRERAYGGALTAEQLNDGKGGLAVEEIETTGARTG